MLMLIILFLLSNTQRYIYVLIVTLTAKDNEKLSKLIKKEFKRSVYSNEFLKQKVRIKIRKMNVLLNDNFSNQIFLKSIDYLF